MRMLAALVSISTLLSGCIADEPQVAIEPQGGGPLVPPEPNLPPDDEAFPNATFDGVLDLSIGTALVSANPASDAAEFLFAFDVPEGAVGGTVTMTWTATQSMAQNLQLLVEDADGKTLAEGAGASPLVVPFEAEELAALHTRTFAAAGGVAKDQPFHLDIVFS